jgi:hypothetical protein
VTLSVAIRSPSPAKIKKFDRTGYVGHQSILASYRKWLGKIDGRARVIQDYLSLSLLNRNGREQGQYTDELRHLGSRQGKLEASEYELVAVKHMQNWWNGEGAADFSILGQKGTRDSLSMCTLQGYSAAPTYVSKSLSEWL